MSSRINGLKLRRVFGVKHWHPPVPYGRDGFLMMNREATATAIVNAFDHEGGEWVHASMSRTERMPDYEDLLTLHSAVWGEGGWAYQMFMPKSQHVNIHSFALHLWGRLDGKPVLPDFVGLAGTV